MGIIQPKTRKKLAHELSISTQTFRRWLEQRGIKIDRGLISIDDKRVPMSAVRNVMFAKLSADIKLTISPCKTLVTIYYLLIVILLR